MSLTSKIVHAERRYSVKEHEVKKRRLTISQHHKPNRHIMFHAHVYFPLKNIAQAEELKNRINAERRDVLTVFPLNMGLVGPHKMPMFEVHFANDDKGFTQWLNQARGDFPVLIHPIGDNDLIDHTEHAVWLGRELGVFEDKLS
ncbi:DOPA 4,5-dioxygenase [Vibrio genomosp. F10]|uniref:DOPA 4,5-dioxygenase n=3 Tax=Vibrio genomosp. F10 TaxID=723171 RepID=A0A1B9QZ82_9VIBR|nr:DOPA 4,5-dioxygenase [Vibrio genomosp. F10]OEE31357.1 DOPA 4,5-dioxygenase [Vibrio genomosp. F10 str. ZF-129]OEE96474.1 DOPA 4,5-dioxygenase [Vibrio genomosp. F10 str. 9ZC157]OEF08170.1 DOPA 4,5-dioxygenase [Vibrio genomosp. F10 str. 9ZD137]